MNYILKYNNKKKKTVILNYNNISQYYCLFNCIIDQIIAT